MEIFKYLKSFFLVLFIITFNFKNLNTYTNVSLKFLINTVLLETFYPLIIYFEHT